MTPVASNLSIGIISWDGMAQAADAIACQVSRVCADVVVVHSDAADSRPQGSGRWIYVPQEQFFGRKFERLLSSINPENALLLIQADATCADWCALVSRFSQVMAQHPSVGVWAPLIDHTAFPIAIVAVGVPHDDLVRVTQTDGIVLGMSCDVLARLRELDYSANNLGWGIDWAAVAFCRRIGLESVCDLSQQVHHPRSRGYNSEDAARQMHKFFEQMDADDRAVIQTLMRTLDMQAFRRLGQTHMDMTVIGEQMEKQSVLHHVLSDAPGSPSLCFVSHGRVILGMPEGHGAAALLDTGERIAAVRKQNDAQMLFPLDFSEDWPEGVYTAPTTGEAWSCPGQSTISCAFAPTSPAVRCDLIAPIELPSTLGDLHLRLGAAVHRANADILIEYQTAGDPETREEIWVKLDPRFTGTLAEGDYQKIDVRLPDTRAPRSLRIRICYWGQTDSRESSVVLCTRPYLVSTALVDEASSATMMIADHKPAADWYEIALPACHGDLALLLDEQPHLLLSKPSAAVRLEMGDGRLTATSDAYSRYCLVVNNRPIRLLWLGPERQILPIPDRVLVAAGTRIELRDPTGNIICAEYQIALSETSRRAGTMDAAEDVMCAPGDSRQEMHPDAWLVQELFDQDFYLAGFPPGQEPDDPASHYLWTGWKEGRDPAPWFSTWHYMAMHPDVAAVGTNPFLHYCIAGRREARALPQLGGSSARDVYTAHAQAVAPGPHFEEFDPTLGTGRRKRAKVLAYYLPQFHPVAVNDQQWGKGFTEWRQLPRAMPRYLGHIQPRIPRDLGHYSLAEGDALRRQIAMAKAAGVFGFCFYHYWFDGKRVLESPMEQFLADPTLDFPFCLMWANENWTRTWDGSEKDVILGQNYREEDDIPFIDDIARHMKDPRYVRIDGRPLFFIYRPGQIPNSRETIARWRELMRERHDLSPLIFMAQGFKDLDPRAHGLDGAIEFPPHKVAEELPSITAKVALLDPDYRGNIIDYDDMVTRSCEETRADFPLIRTVTPTWDNEARRPGRGMILHGSTPAKFRDWIDRMLEFARENPVYGEQIVCVNAWNEWAEGAVLEPDVHHGAAYLNALARAVHNVRPLQDPPRTRVVVVGHDAHSNGAQTLALHLGQTLARDFGVEVAFVLGADGPLRDRYREIGDVHLADGTEGDIDTILSGLAERGFELCITNTTPSGWLVPALKRAGFVVVSLIHELPNLLRSYDLSAEAQAIAQLSDHVVFPAEVVRDGFTDFAGPVSHAAEVVPQGLYNSRFLDMERGDAGLRAELGLDENTRIVLGMGYGDLRKGIDRFISAGLSLCTAHDDIAFLWVGAPARETSQWFQPEIDASGPGARVRILGYRDDIERFYAAADVFYLSSREDPFPSVVLESLAFGLPVVAHAGCGGCDALIARHGTLVPQADPMAAARALLAALAPIDPEVANARRAEIAHSYSFRDYAFGLLQRLLPNLPSLSAVIPNYAYRDYIGERLHSVFDQSMPLHDIVVLDDASPDDSVAEIERTAQAARRRISLHVNARNSGSPFRQWRKGIELAEGEYVWIGEADDLADPDFAARLIARMRLAGSVLGFTDSRQIDEHGAALGDSYRPYVNQIEAGAFDEAFDMDGSEFLQRFLAVKNVILNVSGAIIHRQSLLDAFRAVGEELYSYSVAGDWEALCRTMRTTRQPRELSARAPEHTSPPPRQRDPCVEGGKAPRRNRADAPADRRKSHPARADPDTPSRTFSQLRTAPEGRIE